MSGYSYAPSSRHEWLAVATAGRLLVAKVTDDAEQVSVLAATGAPDTTVQQVLEVLTSKGLTATGPFALLFWVDGNLTGQGLGVIVRGDALVTVETATGTVAVSSRGVTTWTEQVIESATGFSVEVDGGAPQPGLPLTAGAVWMSRIQLSPDGAATRADTEPASAPAASRTPTVESPSLPAPAPAAPTVPAGAVVDEETRVFHTATRSGGDTTAPPTADAAGPTDAAEPDGYDYLFGATVFRPVGAAAGKTPASDEPALAEHLPAPAFLDAPQPSPSASTRGDHDGRTVLASEISAARRQARKGRAEAQAPARPPGQSYELRLPDGTAQALSAPVILGRAPSVSNVPASVLPHLVTLTGDDISRSHVRVAVEGGTVVVTDLHSSNGTHVIAPGKLPQLLRAGEPTPVITGTTIDLGSDVLVHVIEA